MKMRQFLALSILVFLISCSEPSRDEIVREKAEIQLFQKLNDPDSYVFVSLELYDSILYSDNIKYRKEHFQDMLESAQRDIARTDTEERISKYQDDMNQAKRFLSGIDSLEQILGADAGNVASYSYLYIFRANNAMGAKTLNEYIVQVTPSPEFSILQMTDDPNQIILNPNDFPGYREMAMHITNLSQLEVQ
jgi:hypothetical protein